MVSDKKNKTGSENKPGRSQSHPNRLVQTILEPVPYWAEPVPYWAEPVPYWTEPAPNKFRSSTEPEPCLIGTILNPDSV